MHVTSHCSKTVELGARLAGLSHLVRRGWVWVQSAPDCSRLPAVSVLWEQRSRLLLAASRPTARMLDRCPPVEVRCNHLMCSGFACRYRCDGWDTPFEGS